MTSTLFTIITLVIISFLVIGLMVFSYCLIIKDVKKLSSNGLLDEEFINEDKVKEKKWVSVVLTSLSIFLSVSLVALCVIGTVYRANDQQLVINNKTAMVIASNSMEDYYDDDYKDKLTSKVANERGITSKEALCYLDNTQFNIGDLLTFSSLEKDNELSLYNVYGYKNKKGQIIVHRLVDVQGDKYIFRGDNTLTNDSTVSRDQILYSYNDGKLMYVGNVVLFFSSSFGIYTLFIVVLVFVMSDVSKHQYNKIKKERLDKIEGKKNAYQ